MTHPPQPPYGQQPPPGMPPPPGGPGPQQMAGPPPGKQPKPKKFGWLAVILFAVGGLIIGSAIGNASGGGGEAGATATVTVTKAAEAEAGKPAEEKKAEPEKKVEAPVVLADGDWLVGTDIKLGTYRTKEAVAGGLGCYAVTKDKDGTILEQEVTNKGKTIVKITKQAYTFSSSGCGEWEKVG